MDTFIKIYIAISLWLWTGLFLSSPSLQGAFVDMHRRIIERVYKAIKKQVVKLIQKTAGFISRKLRTASHYMQESSYDLRVSVARSLVSKELLKELMHKNLVYAISQARMMDQGDSGVGLDERDYGRPGYGQAGRSQRQERSNRDSIQAMRYRSLRTVNYAYPPCSGTHSAGFRPDRGQQPL